MKYRYLHSNWNAYLSSSNANSLSCGRKSNLESFKVIFSLVFFHFSGFYFSPNYVTMVMTILVSDFCGILWNNFKVSWWFYLQLGINLLYSSILAFTHTFKHWKILYKWLLFNFVRVFARIYQQLLHNLLRSIPQKSDTKIVMTVVILNITICTTCTTEER